MRCSASSAPTAPARRPTIRTLLDLLHPTAGSARIFGLDSRRDSVAIRARLGNLPGRLRLRQARHRARGAATCWPGCAASRTLGRAEELARRFRADLDRPLGQLSRGNRQKVGLILALFHRPELLILDEPTERPRPADAGGVPRPRRRGTRAGPRRLHLLARARRGRARLRSRRDHPRGQADRGRAGGRPDRQDAAAR